MNITTSLPGTGEIINYTPVTNTSSYSLYASRSGYVNDQTISRQTYTWKALSNNSNGTIDIMGVPISSMNQIYFNGPTGYNNSVYFLDEICNALYSNTTLGITARSIGLDDIESKMNNDGLTNRNTYCSFR